MKTLNSKVKYKVDGEKALLYAYPKSGRRRLVQFASCHLATIPLLKKDGIAAHRDLLTMGMNVYQGVDGKWRVLR